MIVSVNYADKRFKRTQKLNTKTAKEHGIEKVYSYSPKDIDEEYIKANSEIWKDSFGGGFFIWKPYVIKKTLSRISDGDYLVYTDSGCIFIDDISILIDVMKKDEEDIMLFSLDNNRVEKFYCKRDVFVIMGCDEPCYTDTPQVLGTYMIFRKSEKSIKFVDEWYMWAQDHRITTRTPENCMGKENYPGYLANRTQAVISIMAKRDGLRIYRDPSQYGNSDNFPQDIIERSTYKQVFDSHRNRKASTMIGVKFGKTEFALKCSYKWYLFKKKHRLV